MASCKQLHRSGERFHDSARRRQTMSGKVTVTLDGRDVAAAINELSAAGRRLVGAVSDAATKKREAILRVVTALGAAQANPPSIGRIRKRPILPLQGKRPR